MAEATPFTIGARASCSDGPCGEVSRILIDPAAGTVSHLVVQPGSDREAGRLVPVDLADAVGGEVRLRCTLAEFGRLEHAAEREMVAGMEGISGNAYGSAPELSRPGHRWTAVEDVIPEGETQVKPGDPVHATDGEVGRIQGFLVDPGDHRATHVLLEEGHLWGRRQVAIPMSAVVGTAAGLRLNLSKRQIADLPPVDIEHPGG